MFFKKKKIHDFISKKIVFYLFLQKENK